MINEIINHLASSHDITPEVFNFIWNYKEKLPLLDLLRPLKNYTFYQLVGDQGIKLMVQVLKYANRKKKNKLVNELINYWFEIAYKKLDKKVSFSIDNIVITELLYFEVTL